MANNLPKFDVATPVLLDSVLLLNFLHLFIGVYACVHVHGYTLTSKLNEDKKQEYY